MSGKFFGLILERFPARDQGHLLTALVLGDAADQWGRNVCPGVGRIASLSLQSKRTVQYHLADFRESSFLIVTSQGGGRYRTTNYRINEDWLLNQPSRLENRNGAMAAPFTNSVQTVQKGCTEGEGNGAQTVHEPVHPTPDPVYPPPPSTNIGGGGGLSADQIQEHIDAAIWASGEAGKPARNITGFSKAVRTRVRTGPSPEDLIDLESYRRHLAALAAKQQAAEEKAVAPVAAPLDQEAGHRRAQQMVAQLRGGVAA